jgi:hypothetical protein
MFFAAVFSEFDANEILAVGSGNSIDDVIVDLENQDIDFDQYFDSGNVTVFEGDIVQLNRVSQYTVER